MSNQGNQPASETAPPLGLRACAKVLGISHGRLAALVSEKRVPRNTDGSFDVEAVRAAFERTKDPAQRSRMKGSAGSVPEMQARTNEDAPVVAAPPAVSPVQADTLELVEPQEPEELPVDAGYNAVKTQHERVRLQLAEIELAQRHRRLIAVEDVEKQARETAHQVREGMLAIPDRVASLVAAENDAGKVHDILAGEIRKALIAVSDQVSIQ